MVMFNFPSICTTRVFSVLLHVHPRVHVWIFTNMNMRMHRFTSQSTEQKYIMIKVTVFGDFQQPVRNRKYRDSTATNVCSENMLPEYGSSVPDLQVTTNPDRDTNSTSQQTLLGSISAPQGVMRHFYILFGSIGFVDNLVVIAVFFMSASLRQRTTCLFLINQSLIDCLASVSLVLEPFTKFQPYISGFWGEIVCRLWLNSNIFWSLLTASTFNLCAVSIETYLAIVRPIAHKLSFSRGKAILVMVCVWLLGFLVNSYNIAASGLITNLCFTLYFWPSNFARRAMGVVNFVLKFLIPLGIFAFTYGGIFRVLKTKVENIHQSSTSSNADKYSKSKRNSAKLLFTVVVAFVVCSAWNQIFFLALNLGALFPIGAFHKFTVVMLFLNCCINPFIYVARYKDFRTGLTGLLRKMGIRVNTGPTDGFNMASSEVTRGATAN